jgi:DNA mismatch repair protein MutL
VAPSEIDVNIHPTKTEVKFTDEKSIYQILRSTVKKALGQNNIAPSIDFDVMTSFEIPYTNSKTEIKVPKDHSNSNYNPFNSGNSTFKHEREKVHKNWDELYKVQFENFEPKPQPIPFENESRGGIEATDEFKAFRLAGGYIFTTIKSGVAIIHQCRAHERIAYERLIQDAAFGNAATQMSLFPIIIEYNASDFSTLNQIFPELKILGFDIDVFGANSLVVRGIPAGCENLDIKDLLDSCLEGFKNTGSVENKLIVDKIARTMAKKLAVKQSVNLDVKEIKALVEDLFICEHPYSSPDGKPVLITMNSEELDQKFLR